MPELRVLSQRIAKNATEAAAGKGGRSSSEGCAQRLRETLEHPGQRRREAHPSPPSPEAVKPQMDVVQQDWDGLRKNADSILASEQTVLSLHQVASTLAETIPQLQVEYEEVVDILLENGAPADQGRGRPAPVAARRTYPRLGGTRCWPATRTRCRPPTASAATPACSAAY
ncbi:type IV pili methyl-accepting chemotaxis transducer N-terminal domain-containing protein [Pseudomonas aeruginosa]